MRKDLSLLFLILILLSFSRLLVADDFHINKYLGNVLINGQKASKSFPLQPGDMIEVTGKSSYIFFSDKLGANFILKPGKLKLKKFTDKKAEVLLLKGRLFYVVNNKKAKRKLLIKTKNAIFQGEGIKYMVESTNLKDYLCVSEGVVTAKKFTDKKTFSVSVGADLLLYYNQKKSTKQHVNPVMYNLSADIFEEMGIFIDRSLIKR